MIYDITVIGGGPSGATAAEQLAKKGFKVALIDRAGRIKPCGGAIPPRLIEDFEIPQSQLVAKIKTARMISPTNRKVDIPIENGYVGMVDREFFDEYLRERAAKCGAKRFTGTFVKLSKNSQYTKVDFNNHSTKKISTLLTRYVIGADGAKSNVARNTIKDAHKIPYVIAYHEIIEAPKATSEYNPDRCDVIYNGDISPDFYGWVFPHGKSASVGMGTGINSVNLKKATSDLRTQAGLDKCSTIRKEGAPIPLKPLERWDNGDNVVLAGDAAGVVAPSSGEGIYYAMIGGKYDAVRDAFVGERLYPEQTVIDTDTMQLYTPFIGKQASDNAGNPMPYDDNSDYDTKAAVILKDWSWDDKTKTYVGTAITKKIAVNYAFNSTTGKWEEQ